MITMYATACKGTGNVQQVGKFEDWDDIEIRIEMFDRDVVITFVGVAEPNPKE